MISSMASRGSDSAAAMVSTPTGPPPKLSAIAIEIAPVHHGRGRWRRRRAARSAASAISRDDAGRALDHGEIAHPAQQPPGDARRAARAPGDLVGAVVGEREAEHARAARARCPRSSADRVEIQPDRDAETVAQRRRQQARAGGGADQRERREVDLDRARRRALADDQVELEILHRGIEDFLHRRVEAMDFVDEQDVARLQIGELRGEIAGLGDHRPRGRAEIDAELARHDLRQRRLAEAGRADEQHMVERLAARRAPIR